MTIFAKEMTTKIIGVGYNQFGKEVLITQMGFSFLEALFEVDPEVQRKIDPSRRSEIRDFILKSTEKSDFYFSPFVFSARGSIAKTEDGGWELKPGSKLFILDGMHRSAGLSSAIRDLIFKKESAEETNQYDIANKVQESLDKIRTYPVSMQIYLDLTQEEERQLFTDINTERREAHIGMVMQYDHRDEYTILTRKVANKMAHKFEIEQKLSRISKQSSALTSLAIMRKCLLAMFEGDLSAKRNDATHRNVEASEMEAVVEAFFEAWIDIFPKNTCDRKRYVAGISGIQIALAYSVLLLSKKYNITHHEAIHKLSSLKKLCTWKHDDPLFSHLYSSTTGIITNHSRTSSVKVTALEFVMTIEKGGL